MQKFFLIQNIMLGFNTQIHYSTLYIEKKMFLILIWIESYFTSFPYHQIWYDRLKITPLRNTHELLTFNIYSQLKDVPNLIIKYT